MKQKAAMIHQKKVIPHLTFFLSCLKALSRMGYRNNNKSLFSSVRPFGKNCSPYSVNFARSPLSALALVGRKLRRSPAFYLSSHRILPGLFARFGKDIATRLFALCILFESFLSHNQKRLIRI